jgi:hypothetical protein
MKRKELRSDDGWILHALFLGNFFRLEWFRQRSQFNKRPWNTIPTMPTNLFMRVIETAIKGLSKTIVEGIIHILILVASFALPLLSGKSDWEAFTIFVWVSCGLVAIHLVRAIVVVWAEVSRNPKIQEIESAIYGPDNTRPRQTVVQQPTSSYQIKLFGIGLVGLTILGGVSFAVFAVKSVLENAGLPTPPPQSTEVYMECHQMTLPIRIPPGDTVHAKVFNKKQYGNTKSAMWDYRNYGTEERLWPDLKIINSVKYNPGVFGYECDVTNHAQTNLMDVTVQLSTNFPGEKTPLINDAIISPLDAGKTFSFYLINECPVMLSVISPNLVMVHVFGEDKERVVPLHWPLRNPIEQIMIFMPSEVRWTGNACE